MIHLNIDLVELYSCIALLEIRRTEMRWKVLGRIALDKMAWRYMTGRFNVKKGGH
jgi:hypothetical protein